MPSSTRNATTGFLLAGAGAVLFATKGVFSKALAGSGVDYLTVTAMRALLALPLFAVLAVWRGVSLRGAPRGALGLAALAGILCYGFGALLDFRALELIDVSLERALMFSYPALIVAWIGLTRRQLPDVPVLLALALTYAGMLLVVGAFDLQLWRQNLGGAALVLCCAACTAAYFLLGERAIPHLGSTGFTIVAMAAAAVTVVIAFLLRHPVGLVLELQWRQWLLLMGLAVVCMFLPTLCQAEGIRRIGAQRGSMASMIGPPAAMLLGVALLGERPGTWQLLGTGLIVAGIALIARPRQS
ncbi:MAG TPA: DMT family transporter [Steroidobacteraceae bacterium]|nr:DMT family transporter [Steroidobacteraceae bacterium]